MTVKKVMVITALVLAMAALAIPLISSRAQAAGSVVEPAALAPAVPVPASVSAAARRAQRAQGLQRTKVLRKGQVPVHEQSVPFVEGRLSDETLKQLGIPRLKKGTDMAALNERIKNHILNRGRKSSGKVRSNAVVTPNSGQPTVLNAQSALSAAMITAIGGRDNQFSEVTLLADWDGREDCAADREIKVDDFSFVEPEIDFTITRTAISEHTIANGFTENIFYYGDSVGNVWIGADTDGDGSVDDVSQINLVAELSLTVALDDQVTVTGLAVNPVADFGGASGPGEILWGSFTDTEGFRQGGGGGTPSRSGLFFILIDDAPDVGFPITVAGTGLFGMSTQSSPAGVAVDDNGDVYWQVANLIQFTGGSIFKVFDIDGDRLPDIAFVPYSGTSTTFGNIVAITNGPCNTIYAAVARSFVATDDGFTQLTEGRFPAPTEFANGLPSMIISFADCSGDFDPCSGIATGTDGSTHSVLSQLPIADHFADVAVPGQDLDEGVNNFRVFALGNGPDIRPPVGQAAGVATSSTLKIDMQIDFTAHAGIMVDENNSVFVISGGTPAGIGTNPSPLLGEILCFEDVCPADRRGDFVDLRGNAFPNPPASGGNVGDGDSDRFDHIFYQSPLDQVTLTPAGLAGLARGFLRYTNRLAPVPIGPGVSLGSTARMLGDDATTEGPVIFEAFDPGHQVAGGDDQNTPFRGDDDNGLGNPVLVGPLSGGFEFVFGGPVGTAGCVWNGFFLNSNGNITFGAGDTNNDPTVTEFRQGLPRIAPAWADLNPDAQAVNPQATPIQAIGFSGVNSFKIRWINVPEFGKEDCGGLDIFGFPAAPISNTFSVTLFDDGTGIDENASQPLNPANPIGNNAVPFDLQEGPTDLRTTREPNTQILVPCPPRPQGSGIFVFDYCRMDLLGTAERPVITGYSIGGLDPLNPPGLCETNLSEAAVAAETTFGLIQGQTAAIGCNCLLGEGTEPTIFELFNEGVDATVGAGGEVTFATPDFDLRFEGNDPQSCTPARQRDLNRQRVAFLGIGCAPPANAICQTVVPAPFATTPSTTGLVNALCAVQLNIVGCGFFPNESTIICQGFEAETGEALQRPGKTVTTAATLACDTNGDGIAESTVALVTVTPVSCNLVRATIPVSGTFGPSSTSGFPAACCGGAGTITVTTTFTAGDNNAFGPFTRTVTCAIALGTRAPVVFSVTPSDGNCAVVPQDLLISGACFIINGVPSVTSVFAIDRANPATRINAFAFQILNANLIDADFNFGSANAGKTFLIFVQGPGGISRNITTAVAGSPAGCPLGNEQGVQVTFTCNSSTTPGTTPGSDIAVLTRCQLNRNSTTGKFTLDVFGTNIKEGATVTVNGQIPKKVKFKDLVSGTTNTFTRVTLVKKVCASLNGSASIVITNPGTAGGPSAPLLCAERCPTN